MPRAREHTGCDQAVALRVGEGPALELDLRGVVAGRGGAGVGRRRVGPSREVREEGRERSLALGAEAGGRFVARDGGGRAPDEEAVGCELDGELAVDDGDAGSAGARGEVVGRDLARRAEGVEGAASANRQRARPPRSSTCAATNGSRIERSFASQSACASRSPRGAATNPSCHASSKGISASASRRREGEVDAESVARARLAANRSSASACSID